MTGDKDSHSVAQIDCMVAHDTDRSKTLAKGYEPSRPRFIYSGVWYN
jgi:hypothetical protein